MKYWIGFLFVVLIATWAQAQSDDELRLLGKTVDKAGKLTRTKNIKEWMKYCVRNVDSARKKRKANPNASIAFELKNIQLKIRALQPLAAGESRQFQEMIDYGLRQVVGFLIRNGIYRAWIQKFGGIQRLNLETPEGTIRVNVPDDLRPGETGTGSVSADLPAAYAYGVLLADQPMTLDRRPAGWRIPSDASTVKVRLNTRDGMEVLTTQFSIRAGDPASPAAQTKPADLASEAQPPEPKVDLQIPSLYYRLPSIGWIGGPLPIQGTFDGDASTTTIRFDNVQGAILAESLRQTIVEPPRDVYGIMTLLIQEGRQSVSCWFRSLWVSAASPKSILQPGEQTVLTISVTGLYGFGKTVALQLDNLTPENATLEGGAHQMIVIPAMGLQPGGTFQVQRVVTGIQPLAFQTSAGINNSTFIGECQTAD